MIRPITFDEQIARAKDDGGVYRNIYPHDGILWGCEITSTSTEIEIASGLFTMCGRMIWVDGKTVFPLEEPLQNGYAQLKAKIDLNNANTQEECAQWATEIVYSTTANFPQLTQEDINGTGKIYEQELAVVKLENGNITEITRKLQNAGIDAEKLGGEFPENYLQASGHQKLDGKLWIIHDNTHLRMMQNAPTGDVGGWYIDNHNANTPTFRIALLDKDGVHKSTSLQITPTGAATLFGTLSTHGYTIDTVDGSLWIYGGSSRLRLHHDSGNILYLHRYNSAGTSITGTVFQVAANNTVTFNGAIAANNGITLAQGKALNVGSVSYFEEGSGTGIARIKAPYGVKAVDASGGKFTSMYALDFLKQSSERYKKNIVDVDDEELHKVLRVAVKRFMYKSDQEGKVETGVIAEQLHAIGLTAPVNYDREGRPDAVDYSKFTPYLIGLAQEQEKRIAELETKAKKCEALSALLISKGILTQEEIDGLDV